VLAQASLDFLLSALPSIPIFLLHHTDQLGFLARDLFKISVSQTVPPTFDLAPQLWPLVLKRL